ncbi:arginase family protein [Bacillus massilinigeriensis]|uniref:arginase family protein n=1 Tax=Bacillus massilionigeriensis TaxID=1805475 RepID=UPI00096AEAEF|nr:arginase family protein [Bacillus massilionigeriensis]
MGLLNRGMTILDFDETYYAQKKLQKFPHERIDFQQMQHVSLYCEQESLTTIEKKLSRRKQKGVTFIGSGNYHYVTYLLLKEVKEPFTLILFDNHPDLGTNPNQRESILSCGSWVSYALSEILYLQKVVIIGPTTLISFPSRNPRVVLFPYDRNHHYSIKSILSVIHSQNVYISIDKDVLNPNEAVTNWDQGLMDIVTLSHFLENILKNKRVEGVDICGEMHLSPLEIVLPDYQSSINKNEKANITLLKTSLKFSSTEIRGA